MKSGKYLETILHARLILRNDDLSIKIGHDTSLFTILSNRSLKKFKNVARSPRKFPTLALHTRSSTKDLEASELEIGRTPNEREISEADRNEAGGKKMERLNGATISDPRKNLFPAAIGGERRTELGRITLGAIAGRSSRSWQEKRETIRMTISINSTPGGVYRKKRSAARRTQPH